jgi:hypothetical protein
MDATFSRIALLMVLLTSMGASARSRNFLVEAPTQQLAQQVAQTAEQFRRDLAIEWLGQELRNWGQPCPITVHTGPNMGAGGVTSFVFDEGEVFGWQMTVQGSPERILDSVLPHEITHTIFATHFRKPVPRWADEGGCTTVEHASEIAKQQQMLTEFLHTGRGIPFSKMFKMKEYPRDILPLYAQGYSLSQFLILQGGRQKFVKFLETGMNGGNWPQALAEHYGIADLGTLQETWVAWVREGGPTRTLPGRDEGRTLLASNSTTKRNRPEPNLIYRGQVDEGASDRTLAIASAAAPKANSKQAEVHSDANASWKSDSTNASQVAPMADPFAVRNSEPNAEPAAYLATRPQPAQPPRQIILEWSKGDGGTITR